MISKISLNCQAKAPSFRANDSEEKENQYYKNIREQKVELEALANDRSTPSIISKPARAAVVVASAILSAGLMKVSLNKTLDIIGSAAKSRFTKHSMWKTRNIYRRTMNALKKMEIPKKIGENNFVKSVKTFAETKWGELAKTKQYASIMDGMKKIMSDPRVLKFKEDIAKLTEKIPTAQKFRKGTVNTIAGLSAVSGAMTGAGLTDRRSTAVLLGDS